jgi:hypothetical protein
MRSVTLSACGGWTIESQSKGGRLTPSHAFEVPERGPPPSVFEYLRRGLNVHCTWRDEPPTGGEVRHIALPKESTPAQWEGGRKVPARSQDRDGSHPGPVDRPGVSGLSHLRVLPSGLPGVDARERDPSESGGAVHWMRTISTARAPKRNPRVVVPPPAGMRACEMNVIETNLGSPDTVTKPDAGEAV